MAQGPPPSEAGPSKSARPTQREAGYTSTTAHTSTFHVQPPSEQLQTAPNAFQTTSYNYSHVSTPSQPQNMTFASTPSYAYYSHPQSWNNAWQTYSYNPGPSASYQYTYQPVQHQGLQRTLVPAPPPTPLKRKTPSPSPSPPPPPPFHNEWDRVIKDFLIAAGLTQTLRGFETDMIVMNPEWERKTVPVALSALAENLTLLKHDTESRPLDERKLSHTHFAPNIEPQTPTSVTKDISQFLAKNRARNNVSNRKEFLLSLAEKRRKLEEAAKATGVEALVDDISSCARTDAKMQDRETQMKYDIAKNEDGPLRKTVKAATTMKSPATPSGESKQTRDILTAEKYPAFDERLQNLETHLAVRYVPSPPRSLVDRIQFMEDHIIHLEKQFPPWAALHFNQPNRGWPAPPRLTPIIVPSHLTSTAVQQPGPTAQGPEMPDNEDHKVKKAKASGRTKSSLHRAVMERLEVQKAIEDLSGVKSDEHDGRTQ